MIQVYKDSFLLLEKEWFDEAITFLDEHKLQSDEVIIKQPPYIAWHLAKEVDGKRFCTNPYHIDVNNTVVNEWLTREQYDTYCEEI